MDRIKTFLDNPHLQGFHTWIKEGVNVITDTMWQSPKALLTALTLDTGRSVLFVTEKSAILNDLPYFISSEVWEYPAWETLPSEEIPPSPDIVGERYKLLSRLQGKNNNVLIVTSLQALLQKVIPKGALQLLRFKTGEKFPFNELPHRLNEMGYHKRPVAADKGEYAVRGGIVDIYPVSSADPCRIEFWEDEIVSIRKYDPVSQASFEKIDEVLITPGEELELLTQHPKQSTILDYFDQPPILIFDNIAEIEEKFTAYSRRSSPFILTLDEFFALIAPLQTLFFSDPALETISQVQLLQRLPVDQEKISFELFNREFTAMRFRHPFFPLLPLFSEGAQNPADLSVQELITQLMQFSEKITLRFLCESDAEENHLLDLGVRGEIERGYLSSGFYLHSPSIAVIPMSELTHRTKIRRQKMRSAHASTTHDVFALAPGEAVVHLNSGIGRYLGIERRPNYLGIETEYMVIEYAEGAKLYVAMEQANLISKYIGATDKIPEFHTLGSTRWKRAYAKTQEAIVGYAHDLLQMQAERVVTGGFAFRDESEATKQFVEEFPYEETPDQLKAIDAVFQDMKSNVSMDRLICGDVGYGKTEIAMRAAFKAVVDGEKQVAVLVPTTVLALQHYETFSERMINFPITIGLLSRFGKPKETKETIAKVATGGVDIVIGTHRMISGDVEFKDLGLVVIDEEQRFGVRAKEHLKKIKKGVDCLILSATPIPRTLYLSLVGARDLSVINTPPEDRLPIHSVVCQSTDEIIQNALMRELARGGQAYVIHNRIETIYKLAEKIRTLLPKARTVIAHGQMSADDLDLVFHAFKAGNIDILVATSIVENGLDIPNANTILIDQADRSGLADLYQMRGRVGRWDIKAYCYFLVSNMRMISDVARKRLSALTQATGYGSGMKIALEDLSIRGAGNILGTEQSGHVETIGFHLYCKLLKKTIAALRKKERPTFFNEVKIEFPYDARFSDEYIEEPSLRLELYHRLADAENVDEIEKLFEEIRDRFGPLPTSVLWLKAIARIRLEAAKWRFTLLKLTKNLLITEQIHKKEKVTNKIVLKKMPATFEELESVILETLRQDSRELGF